ncbi:MAG: O-antigen ligase family protein [Candidatus Omnitrophica bacterium]|nr:O-antigen ligase family protein [Candidatus Omnitrophota bacterium]
MRFLRQLSHWSLWFAVGFLPFSKSGAEIGVAVLIASWLTGKILYPQKLIESLPFRMFYLLFLGAVLLSFISVTPQDFWTAVRGLVKWVKYLTLFFVCQDLFQDKKLTDRTIKVFAVSMLLLTINGFYQMLSGEDWIKHYSVDIPGRLIRMRSSLQSPNDLSTFYLLALPLAFSTWIEHRRWSISSASWVVILLLFFTALIMTLSRSAFFAFLFGVCFYFLFRLRKPIYLALFLIPALGFIIPGILRENFFESLRHTDQTIVERIEFWKISWKMILEHPWIGNGINLYVRKFASFAPLEETYRGYAHNAYLQIWCETGLFGLLFFILPLGFAIFRAIRTKKPDGFGYQEALLVGMVAYLAQAFFDTHFFAMQVTFLFWIFWGMFVSQLKNSER